MTNLFEQAGGSPFGSGTGNELGSVCGPGCKGVLCGVSVGGVLFGVAGCVAGAANLQSIIPFPPFKKCPKKSVFAMLFRIFTD